MAYKLKRPVRMIGLDLDGTLYDDRKHISQRDICAIRQAIAMGVEVVPATGRPFKGVPEQLLSISGIHYVLTNNGAGLYRLEDGKCLYHVPLDKKLGLELVERLERLDITVDVLMATNAYCTEQSLEKFMHLKVGEGMRDYVRSTRTVVDDLQDFLRGTPEEMYKLTLNFQRDGAGGYIDREKAIAIAESYPRLIWVSGGMNNVEITDKDADKGKALLVLGKLLGIDREEIMACGDSGNDKGMLEVAGVGVAMKNAEDAIKAAADHVTGSNNESGVARALEKFVLRADPGNMERNE